MEKDIIAINDFWSNVKKHKFEFEWSENPPSLEKLWREMLHLYGNNHISQGKKINFKQTFKAAQLAKIGIAGSTSSGLVIASPFAGLIAMAVTTGVLTVMDSSTNPIVSNKQYFQQLKKQEYEKAILQWVLDQGFTSRYEERKTLIMVDSLFTGTSMFNEGFDLKLKRVGNHYELNYSKVRYAINLNFVANIENKNKVKKRREELAAVHEIEYLDL